MIHQLAHRFYTKCETTRYNEGIGSKSGAAGSCEEGAVVSVERISYLVTRISSETILPLHASRFTSDGIHE
jgi:hypothetical protein